ncbi:MAG: hypothetical protein ACPL6C_02240 [bacterium]
MRRKALLIAFEWGIIWGIFEATLGGALSYFPYRGAIMSNIALGLVAYGIARSKDYRAALFMGIIASLTKLTDSFILGVPVLSKVIIAPATAIIIESFVFSFVFRFMGFLEHKRLYIAGPVAIMISFAIISPFFVYKGFVENWAIMIMKVAPAVGISVFVCPLMDHLERRLEAGETTR